MISREEEASFHGKKKNLIGDNAETQDALLEKQELSLNKDFEKEGNAVNFECSVMCNAAKYKQDGIHPG